MYVALKKHTCEIWRQDTDPIFRSGGYGSADSRFLYHVKKALIARGHDVIKKRMWRDGHLTADTQQYIRSRKLEGGFMIYDPDYAIRDLTKEFNKTGHVILSRVNCEVKMRNNVIDTRK